MEYLEFSKDAITAADNRKNRYFKGNTSQLFNNISKCCCDNIMYSNLESRTQSYNIGSKVDRKYFNSR